MLAAEFAGAFALVFAGCGALMVDAKTGQLGHVGVAITFGLVITAMVYAVGHVSGAHLNPAVTAAFALTRHFPWTRVPAYWAAQIAGALAAAALLRASLGNIAHVGATLPSGSQAQSFLWELVLTAFLMLVIMAVATDTRAVGEAAAIAIGATVGLDAMFGGPISGASMNPARSIGPAVVGTEFHALWLYIVAPLIGAVLGAAIYQFIRGGRLARSTSLPCPRSTTTDRGSSSDPAPDRRWQRHGHRGRTDRPRARSRRRGNGAPGRPLPEPLPSAACPTSSPATSPTGARSPTERATNSSKAGIELVLEHRADPQPLWLA